MKKIIFIVVTLTCLHVFSQSGKVRYTASTKAYFKALEAKPKKNSAVFEKTKANNRDVEYILTFNTKESLFFFDEEMKVEQHGVNMTEVLAGDGLHYFDNKTKEHIVNTDIFGDFFLVNKEKTSWQLTNENRKIGKYNCYKATSEISVRNGKGFKKRKIVAWYTPDIPFNFGPKSYNNLPGLILVLQEGNLFFTATKIELSPKEEIKINKPTKGKKISQKEYEDLISDFLKNRRARTKARVKARARK